MLKSTWLGLIGHYWVFTEFSTEARRAPSEVASLAVDDVIDVISGVFLVFFSGCLRVESTAGPGSIGFH